MDIKKRLELVKRNTEEIIDEAELKKLLREKKQPVVYHGFEPSGSGIHIGYLVGIKKHIDFQKAGLKLKLLCADLHAWLNEKGSLEKIKLLAELYKESFAACGVDMKKAEVILGSTFQLKPEYFTDVLKLSLKTRLLRARRTMTMIGREEKDPHVAQFLYPLMQAIDIKHLSVDIAFSDFAQRKIHMLAREHLPSLNFKKPIAIHHAEMMGLTGGKMSASIPKSRIMIDESEQELMNKIMKAFCPAKKIKDNPILQICKYIIFESSKTKQLVIKRESKYGGKITFKNYEELEKAYLKDLHPLDLKKAVADSLNEILKPIRKHMNSPRIKNLKEKIASMN